LAFLLYPHFFVLATLYLLSTLLLPCALSAWYFKQPYYIFSYTECSILNTTLTTTHEHLHSQNNETNGNIEFLQLYPVVAADALLEISILVISDVLLLDEHLSQTNTSCIPKFCYLFGVLLSYSEVPCQDMHC
jgi:hypothetical protein